MRASIRSFEILFHPLRYIYIYILLVVVLLPLMLVYIFTSCCCCYYYCCFSSAFFFCVLLGRCFFSCSFWPLFSFSPSSIRIKISLTRQPLAVIKHVFPRNSKAVHNHMNIYILNHTFSPSLSHTQFTSQLAWTIAKINTHRNGSVEN